MRTLISLAALAVIVFGCRYAYGRERLRDSLPVWYAEDNVRYFDGQLPPVYLRWDNLQAEGALGITQTNENGYLEVVLDFYQLRSDQDAREVLHHEMCHIATWGSEPVHGPAFQTCMAEHGFIETR